MNKNWSRLIHSLFAMFLLLGCGQIPDTSLVTPMSITDTAQPMFALQTEPSPTQTLVPAITETLYTPTGRIAYISDNALYMMDGNGKAETAIGSRIKTSPDTPPWIDYYRLYMPQWSPDGARLAVGCVVNLPASQYAELNLCILDVSHDANDLDESARNPVIVKIDPGGFGEFGMYITSISWSSNGKYITVISQPSENYFCLVDTKTYEKDCSYPPKQFDGFPTVNQTVFGFSTFSWSPIDDNKAVVPKSPGTLYLIDFSQKTILSLSSVPSIFSKSIPVWSPDGKKVAFAYRNSYLNDKNDIIAISNVDGSGFATLVDAKTFFSSVIKGMFPFEYDEENPFQITPESWSPDGNFLLIEVRNSNFSGIFRYNLPTGEVMPLRFDFGFHTYSSPAWSR